MALLSGLLELAESAFQGTTRFIECYDYTYCNYFTCIFVKAVMQLHRDKLVICFFFS